MKIIGADYLERLGQTENFSGKPQRPAYSRHQGRAGGVLP